MVNKCLEFCQTLVSQQQHFSFSLTVGSSFSFSLDNRKESTNLETRKVTSLKKQMPRKKLSPSQVRRNLKRKQDFLKRKSEHSERESSALKVITFECDHCESVFKSESDMKNHVDSIHTKDDLMRNIEQLDGNSELQILEEGMLSFPLCPVCPLSPACPKDELTK